MSHSTRELPERPESRNRVALAASRSVAAHIADQGLFFGIRRTSRDLRFLWGRTKSDIAEERKRAIQRLN
uniref:Uncharacterized protein n=1 Tax=Mycena chlorophos TaxID=658473 RepID=A0ABQ0LZX9_MYCCL|nr:predicted protein [Mycena chlorophos]